MGIARLGAVLLAVLLAVSCRPAATYHGVAIVGSEKFRGQVQAALELIRDKAPEDFAAIAQYVARIEEHERSGMDLGRATCQLAPPTAYASVTWCAGAIAHEAHHAKLAAEPGHSYGRAEEERACMAVQAAVLQRIGAPAAELEYLATQDGGHFDANGDGEYTQEDYEARSW